MKHFRHPVAQLEPSQFQGRFILSRFKSDSMAPNGLIQRDLTPPVVIDNHNRGTQSSSVHIDSRQVFE